MAQVAPSDPPAVLDHPTSSPTTASSTSASATPSLPLVSTPDPHRPAYPSMRTDPPFAATNPFPIPSSTRHFDPKRTALTSVDPHNNLDYPPETPSQDDSHFSPEPEKPRETREDDDHHGVIDDPREHEQPDAAEEPTDDVDGTHGSAADTTPADEIAPILDEERLGAHPSTLGQGPPPSVMGMVAAFGEMSLAQQMYGHPPQLPIMPMQPLPLVPAQHAPQVAAHASRHHPHHMPLAHQHHLLQHHQPYGYTMWVPQDRVGAVIGGHGAVIKSLQERSGATIQVHNDTVRGDLKLFTIFGTFSQYEVARQLITEIVEKPRQAHGGGHASSDRSPYSPAGDHSSRSTEMWKTVYVPTSCVGLVIGRNGETIRSLQDRSGAEIKVTPDEEAAPGAEMRSILISGTDEAISSAHQLVSEIVMDAKARSPPYGTPRVGVGVNGQPVVHEVLSVPNEKVGLIIGKKGAAIRELQMKSGAKIQVTKDDSSVQSDGTRPVTITGMRANVDEAKAMIANKINIPHLQSSAVSTAYVNSPQQGASSVTSPVGPNQPISYLVPNVYDPAYQNGQQPFQQIYDTNDPNAQNRATTAYFHQYIGYNNYAAMAQQQQRQYQSQMPMHFPHPQQAMQREQHQALHPAHAEHQEQLTQTQFASQQQGQQLEGMQGSPGMVPRDSNGNVIIYPPHYQQLTHQMGAHQMYTSAPLNSRMFPRREHAHAAHAQAQAHMMLHAQAQAQAHAQSQAQAHVHLHTHAQPQTQGPQEESEVQVDGQPRQHSHSSPIQPNLESADQPAGD